MSIRTSIRQEMLVAKSHSGKGDGPMSYWQLAKKALPPLPPSSVYRYLKDERDMSSERCDRMLTALGLVLTPRYSRKLFHKIRSAITSHAKFRRKSLRMVADMAGLPAPTVSRFFSGKMDLTSERCDRLLKALDILIVHHRMHASFVRHRMEWMDEKKRGEEWATLLKSKN
jgi:hypothetical protein